MFQHFESARSGGISDSLSFLKRYTRAMYSNKILSGCLTQTVYLISAPQLKVQDSISKRPCVGLIFSSVKVTILVKNLYGGLMQLVHAGAGRPLCQLA